jgi:hypothetical protein
MKLRKFTILVALLTIMLIAIAPAAAAQFGPKLETHDVQKIRQSDTESGDVGQPSEAAYATCDDFISSAGSRSQSQAQQYFDFTATPEEQAILDTDNDGFACDGWSTGLDTLGVQGGEDGYWASDGYYYYW